MPIQTTALPRTIAAASTAVTIAAMRSRRPKCVITVSTHTSTVCWYTASPAMDGPLYARVSRGSGVPLGTQLVEQIRDAVRDGTLGDDDRLPSVRELAKNAGVNVSTARAVYARLEAEGVVRREHGRG